MKNQDNDKYNVSIDLFLKELKTKLSTSESDENPYHKDSIMTFNKICDHDNGFLCEHRRDWIIEFCRSNFTK